MSWSSGKDSAFALHRLRAAGEFDIRALLVTINADAERVAMHAVRLTLLQAQADRLGIPLHLVEIPMGCPNDIYEARMAEAVRVARGDHVERMAFGDLFLGDVRAYREANLAGTGITPVFPLWEQPTDRLALEMLDAGVRAVITCVDPRALPSEFAGREFDEELLAELPDGVDPCGERGEFHTFVWDSPDFDTPIAVRCGETVERDGFVFCDVLPA
ncbi:MAG TPA: ATP-binding protein [Acidimicrobiia bacterium]|jgi:uncharacterized protein (TIGR00290 family)